eukprot:scaffold131431_cov18-Tisochrysis_lutea.AAC.1
MADLLLHIVPANHAVNHAFSDGAMIRLLRHITPAISCASACPCNSCTAGVDEDGAMMPLLLHHTSDTEPPWHPNFQPIAGVPPTTDMQGLEFPGGGLCSSLFAGLNSNSINNSNNGGGPLSPLCNLPPSPMDTSAWLGASPLRIGAQLMSPCTQSLEM